MKSRFASTAIHSGSRARGWIDAACRSAAIALALASATASAAWYDNPSIVKKVPVAQNVPTHPHFINKSADDSLLLVNLNSSDDNAAPVLLIDMASLADRSVAADEVAMSRPVSKPSEGFGSGWKGGAISAKLGLALMGGGTSSETCAIATDGETWQKGAGLKPLSTANGYRIDGLDFSADSQYLYSNFYADSAGGETGQGKLLRWTYDASTGVLMLDREFATSLTRIRNISVHTVNGKELVYCGEGGGSAAKVVAIDVSGDTWTEHVVSSGIEGLAGNITNVKLSNEDGANPVMYVLGKNGRLAVCKLAADGLSVVETLRTFTSAEMLALAGGLSGEDEFVNFEVTKDGKTAFLIKRNADKKNANLCVLASPAYIESDGTQFINTGYYVKPTSRIELDFAFVDFANTTDYIQCRLFDNAAHQSTPSICAAVYVGGNANDYSLAACVGDCGSFSGVWTSNSGAGTKGTYCDSTKRTVVCDELNKRIAIAENGTEVWYNDQSSARTFANTATRPLGLFGRTQNASGTACDYLSRIRVYGFRIYESDALVHDYIPAIKNGVAGLLDSITGAFLHDTRKTTGNAAFATGGDIETVDDDPYIQSAGTDAINLGLGASPKLKVEVDYALTDTTKKQQRIVAQDTAASEPRISIYQNGNGPITLAAVISTSEWNQNAGAVSTGAGNETDRHTAIVDCGERTLSFMTGVTTNWTYSATVPEVVTCATRPLGLFGNPNNDAGTSFKSDNFSTARVYGLKIWADGTLVRDLAPRNINGVAGFEDLVSGKFYTCGGLAASANAPTTLSGPSKEYDAFIESDGSYYSVVDTRYFVKPSTKIEIDYQLASFVNSGIVMGGYGSAAGVSTILWCRSNSEIVMEMRDGNHDSTANELISPRTPPDLARHKAVFDGPGRELSLYDSEGTLVAGADFPESWSLTATANWPVLLFGSADNAYGKSKQRAKARIYGVRFYEGGNLALELTPAVKGGVAGFVDGNGNFYSGDGLTAGGNVQTIEDDPYVASPEGGCFFDTGYTVSSNTCVAIDYMPLEQHANQQFPFEAGARDGTHMFMRTYANGSAGTGDIAYFCGDTDNISLEVPFAPNVRRVLTLDAYKLKAKVETAGKTVREATIGSAGRVPEKSTSTLTLFRSATKNDNYMYGRLYGCKIFEEGELVHDYAPICQGGTYALVDKVTGTVLAMASGSVAFGGDTDNGNLNDSFFYAVMRDEDAYIQSDGTQGINLGYFTTPNTRYEIDFQLTDRVGQYRPFGQANTDIQNLNAELYIQDSLNVAFGVGDTWKGHPTGVASDLNRHVAVVDFANRECGYSGYKMFAFDSSVVCKNTAVVPMWLFAKGKTADGSYGNRAKMRLYAFRIYEAGELVHEYLPYKSGETVGLYDTVTGEVKLNSVNGAKAFAYGGGMGYDKFAGVKTALTTEPADVFVKSRRTATLTAFAPGAVRYIWTRNGSVLAGADSSALEIVWEKPKTAGTPIYGVTPVFVKDGVEVRGAEATAEATMLPSGMTLVLR